MTEILTILVLGYFSSGKTTFIGSISEIDVVSVERRMLNDPKSTLPAMVGMDFGRFTVDDNLVLYFLANPGGRSSITMLTQVDIGLPIDSVVYLSSSDKPKSFMRQKQELHEILKIREAIVVANQQDRVEAATPSMIRQYLDVPPEILVLPCIGTNEHHVRRILLELFATMPQTSTIQKCREAISTSEALSLDLATYDAKPEFSWADLLILRGGADHFTSVIPAIEAPSVSGARTADGSSYQEAMGHLSVRQRAHVGLFGGLVSEWFRGLNSNWRWNSWQAYGNVVMRAITGIVFLLDLTQDFDFDELHKVISVVGEKYSLPQMILLDQAHRVVEDRIRELRMSLPPDLPVLVCDTPDEDVFEQVLRQLHALDNADQFLARIIELLDQPM